MSLFTASVRSAASRGMTPGLCSGLSSGSPRLSTTAITCDALWALAWLLPVGTTPQVGALVALVDAWRRSPSTGLVGPKHVDVERPHLLQGLSIRATRGGRLLPRPAPGEPDQGQYNRLSDVLAVPLAGSLVERDLLTDLGGWERSFGDVGPRPGSTGCG